MTREVHSTVESEIPLLYYISEWRLSKNKYEPINYSRKYRKVDTFKLGNDSHYYEKDGKYYEYVTKAEEANYKSLYSEIEPDLDLAIDQHIIQPIIDDDVNILQDLGKLQTEIKLEDLDKTLSKQNNVTFRSQRRSQLLNTGENAIDVITQPIQRGSELVQTTITDTQEILDSLMLPLIVGAIFIGAVVILK